MKQYKCFIALFAAALFMGACSDDDNDYGIEGVAIETPAVTGETSTSSASLSVAVNMRNDVSYSGAGFCYSLKPSPTIHSATVKALINNGTLTATLTGLAPKRTYYARAFVSIYQGDVVYSPEFTFNTADGTLDEQLAAYQAPAYLDNYIPIAGWEMRNQWNLANVHDPSVVLAEDGYYYMYQTDASFGNAHGGHGHFHARRSRNLIDWEYMGRTMKELPGWVVPKLNEIRQSMGLAPVAAEPEIAYGFWAPCVRKVRNGLYRMYYSITCPGLINGEGSWSERAFIGMMENTHPANNDGWVDKGFVVTNASDKGLEFNVPADDWANCYFKWNAIDPSYIITPEGNHWLIYGSWHSGIAAMELNGATGKPKQSLGSPWAEGNAPAEYGQLIATRQAGNRWQSSEGPEIVYNPSTEYYYLFMAYDALDTPYNTRVARSKSITGPYLGIDGANVSEGAEMLPVVTHPYKFANSDGWVGIAHCAIFDDGNGNWYYASQGRLPEDVNNAVMLGHVRSIRWTKDGWPLVMPERYGDVPQVPITEKELLGDWEHIDLSYAYGEQKASSVMTLTDDYKVSEGTWKDCNWSYDAVNQVLTVNGTDLYLQRETDWEASPRTHTIVYAAYGSNHKTYWGKKVR